MVQRIVRILLMLAAFAGGGFAVLVLIGLWSRHEQTTADYERKNPARTLSQQTKSLPEGSKLVGTGAVENANHGMSVAVSADGRTVVVGGPGPNNADRDRSPLLGPAGAAWVFTLRRDKWSEQGKLVGTTDQHGGGLWSQGASVALSADGKTAIVGGPSDNGATGAAWIFTLGSEGWTQQGNKLVGSSPYKPNESPLSPGQGLCVALSGDGNTAIIGGWRTEGAWVFTRNGGVWTQQGKKLVGSGAVGAARQGMAVALSADGNTAIVGGPADNSYTGAAWIFTRTGDVWTQQGKKMVGSGASGRARQGTSVGLSADGHTAILGGPDSDSSGTARPFGFPPLGAAWVFTRSQGVWMQEGQKLVSTGTGATARQGTSVALSADGNVAALGGLAADGNLGALSIFTRTAGRWAQDNLAGIDAQVKSASSVALSAEANLVVVGAPDDNRGIGAAWVFARRLSGSNERAAHAACGDDVLPCSTSFSNAQ